VPMKPEDLQPEKEEAFVEEIRRLCQVVTPGVLCETIGLHRYESFYIELQFERDAQMASDKFGKYFCKTCISNGDTHTRETIVQQLFNLAENRKTSLRKMFCMAYRVYAPHQQVCFDRSPPKKSIFKPYATCQKCYANMWTIAVREEENNFWKKHESMNMLLYALLYMKHIQPSGISGRMNFVFDQPSDCFEFLQMSDVSRTSLIVKLRNHHAKKLASTYNITDLKKVHPITTKNFKTLGISSCLLDRPVVEQPLAKRAKQTEDVFDNALDH